MKDRITPIAVVVFALLLAGYVGSYFALVEAEPFPTVPDPVVQNRYHYQPTYRIGGRAAELFYWPLHQADSKSEIGNVDF